MEEEKIFKNLKWSHVREFGIFIFAALMYFQNKGLVSDIQNEKKADKENYRKDIREINQTLNKAIMTMDEVIKFKKSFYEKDDSLFNVNSSASHNIGQ